MSAAEDRALELLGMGIGPEQVGPAVGLSVSRISQLLSDPTFSGKVAELRFKSLSKHNNRDSKYDEVEDQLLAKLENQVQYMMKPGEILGAIKIINGAKRRGASAPDAVLQTQQVVHLTMPVQIINQYKMDVNRQIIQAGDQTLVTAQSGSMQALLETHKAAQLSPEQKALEYAKPSTE